MKSTVVKRSVILNGRKTSVSLEDDFWQALNEIADSRRVSVSNLVQTIDRERRNSNLSSAIRVFVFNHVRAGSRCEDERKEGDVAMQLASAS